MGEDRQLVAHGQFDGGYGGAFKVTAATKADVLLEMCKAIRAITKEAIAVECVAFHARDPKERSSWTKDLERLLAVMRELEFGEMSKQVAPKSSAWSCVIS